MFSRNFRDDERVFRVFAQRLLCFVSRTWRGNAFLDHLLGQFIEKSRLRKYGVGMKCSADSFSYRNAGCIMDAIHSLVHRYDDRFELFDVAQHSLSDVGIGERAVIFSKYMKCLCDIFQHGSVSIVVYGTHE
ncbi:hypothetical protein OO006_09080 [Prosthecochloris sp. SCSIO W1101]|uniref:hypothetical protein n=1 Tax=Prosthecochloris sp. SCSIO W1101 TaxID=2992242 RepID=UPI00223E2E6A|nr:hypothetical protein [Prosthecochloris sp. SCSIO W1101]UZJ40510.1 hypothetical protein OO006_09080 [Prosthecochloris sp. SCSIO W1101]